MRHFSNTRLTHSILLNFSLKLQGFGTNELLLTTTLIRYQKIMNEVKVAYEEMKGKTLEEEIKSETRGDYERILLEILAAAE